MPIDWGTYKDLLEVEFAEVKLMPEKTPAAANMKIASAIVNGYVDAMSDGGDPILKAPAILNPAGIALMLTSINAALLAGTGPVPPMVALTTAISTGVMACWTGATLNASACAPLPGHIRHAPISIVLPTGVMLLLPPPLVNPSPTIFITTMITAMKAHLLTVSGMHPTMILPPPAPPYPLPWITYS